MEKRGYLIGILICWFFTSWTQVKTGSYIEIAPIEPLNLRHLNESNNNRSIGIQPMVETISVYEKMGKTGFSINVKGDSVPIVELHSHLKRLTPKTSIIPAFDTYGRIDQQFAFQSAVGANYANCGKNWSTKNQFLVGYTNENLAHYSHTAFQPIDTTKRAWFADIRTRTVFAPSKLFQIQLGIDNQFFGHGYRSLIQSEQVAPMPFASFNVRFWHFEYGMIYQFLQELDSTRHWKFNASHYLGWNVTPKWNITFLENVLFQPTDGTFKRGFEIEYLNPIVFFRPQEYSLGSADNVILSVQSSYRINNQCIYGQAVLDEFVLQEIKARSKWWANKYGVQFGIKGKWKKIHYLTEINAVRPYTFSHINSNQNAGNLGQPIGHPLGSNFVELIGMVQQSYRSFSFHSFIDYYLKGYDEKNVSWGGNIYQNYVTHPLEYGNTIGQGLTQHTIKIGVSTDYFFHHYLKASGFIQLIGNYTWGEIKDQFTVGVSFGLRSQLFSTRRIF